MNINITEYINSLNNKSLKDELHKYMIMHRDMETYHYNNNLVIKKKLDEQLKKEELLIEQNNDLINYNDLLISKLKEINIMKLLDILNELDKRIVPLVDYFNINNKLIDQLFRLIKSR